MEGLQKSDILALLAANAPGSFLDAVPFNGHNIGACDITGVSPVWEMHPDTDELFFILEGEFEMTVLTEDDEEHHVLPAGQCFVVRKGCWHKPGAPTGAKFIYFTPGVSLHSEADDPRTADA